ncbi:ATP-dependent zinc protease [Neptunomonas antarctica]|uniref:Uncharacterized conserved protein n=1 Tax=Neptunomonas antarctica TaxID=619304 RepID=A0A1N7KY70_9GAMM|nr:ATP-dependent zinc protease [Neptunomonas antarctica]SIS66582.1 Uncharacterized conserved protein [Neptunomonas antarctica]
MKDKLQPQKKLLVAGWREWVSLPGLGIDAIKAKMDTGARTSCLHAFEVERFTKGNDSWVKFSMHPNQHDTDTVVRCEAKVLDYRKVTDSGGHCELRYVVRTIVNFGEQSWPAEITLTNRDNMKFRMLVGRTAMSDKMVINPTLSYQFGLPGEQK